MSNTMKRQFGANGLAILALVAILSVSLVPATADVMNKKTIVTFGAPVEVPGKVLPPGTYVFRLYESLAGRNIVQVYDKDEKQLFATLVAVPDESLTRPEKPLIKFEERPAGSPEAIKAWFYPGDVTGMTFVYPHARAAEIAKRTNQNVLSMKDEMAKNITAKRTSSSDPSVQELKKTEVSGVNPAGDDVGVELVIVAVKPAN